MAFLPTSVALDQCSGSRSVQVHGAATSSICYTSAISLINKQSHHGSSRCLCLRLHLGLDWSWSGEPHSGIAKTPKPLCLASTSPHVVGVNDNLLPACKVLRQPSKRVAIDHVDQQHMYSLLNLLKDVCAVLIVVCLVH